MLVLLSFQEFPHVVPMCSFCLLKKKNNKTSKKQELVFTCVNVSLKPKFNPLWKCILFSLSSCVKSVFTYYTRHRCQGP